MLGMTFYSILPKKTRGQVPSVPAVMVSSVLSDSALVAADLLLLLGFPAAWIPRALPPGL